MKARSYLRAFTRGWYLIVVLTIAGGALGFLRANAEAPVYQSSATVYVSTTGASITDLSTGSSYAQEAVKTFADLVPTSSVLGPAYTALGGDVSMTQLERSVSASVPVDTSLVQISANAGTPQLAARIASAVSSSLVTSVAKLQTTPTTSKKAKKAKKVAAASSVQLSLVQVARAPQEPITPVKPLEWTIGVLLGLLVGMGAAMLRDLLDSRIRRERDVQELTTAPVLGSIPRVKKSAARLALERQPRGPVAEAYRALRTNLQFMDFADQERVVVVTSAAPSEGKTTTATSLALAFAQRGDRVCVIDADLRRPRLSDEFGIEGAVGLTDVLIGRTSLRDALQRWGSHSMAILPAGAIPPNPSELLGSVAMERVVAKLAAVVDIIIIDAPPTLPVTDAAVLAKRAAGTLVVSAVGQSRRSQLTKAVASIEQAGGRVFGVVLTKVPRRERKSNYGYGYSQRGRGAMVEANAVEPSLLTDSIDMDLLNTR